MRALGYCRSAALAAVLSLAFSGCGILPSGGEAHRDFSRVCREYQQAVGVLTVTLVDGDGKPFRYENDEVLIDSVVPVATVFAVGPDEFVTNAHVVCGLRGMGGSVREEVVAAVAESELKAAAEEEGLSVEEYSGKYSVKVEDRRKELFEIYKGVHCGAVEIRLSHGAKRHLAVRSFREHPRYKDDASGDRDIMVNGERDCALLYTDTKVDRWFPVADKTTLYALGAGTAIGSLGFPMEGLTENGGLNLESPEATFKAGTIGKVTRPDHAFGTPAENRTIFHSIPLVNGSSGSPVFLIDGRVVAVFWGVNGFEQSDAESEETYVISNPAQQNMALRIDALEETRAAKKTPVGELLR